MITMSIDPSIHGHGVAIWEDGELVLAKFTGGVGGNVNTLIEPIPPLITLVKSLDLFFETVVIERPEHYSQQFQKGSQDDLAILSVCVGATMYALSPFTRSVLLVHPKTWKGQTPKDVTEHRNKQTLTAEEWSRVELPKAKKPQTDVHDAIGIGLWRFRKNYAHTT